MGCLEGTRDWDWKLIVRIFNVVGMLGAIFCSVYGFGVKKVTLKLIIINFYLIIFPVTMLFAEFRSALIRTHFSFLQSYTGRMLMVLFIASLLFVYTDAWNIVFAVWCVVDVFIHNILLCCVRPDFINEERKKFREQAEAQKQSVSNKATAAAAAGATEAIAEEAQSPHWFSGGPGSGGSAQGSGMDRRGASHVDSGMTPPASSGRSGSSLTADSDAPAWAVDIGDSPGAADPYQPSQGGANPFN